ncbi:MAG: ATP-dependent Clp protease adapter ClpS [Candidatus Tectomicrobia bacterium]|uniref:ATP-dependent Clp protease adapter protein ClpS n=1 Tax=Tectimicrobiota bacterium TaxID=2528274 RepID=A0A938B2P4_UNCTE|nr:ATP-dependent Clp protease adapter ClpS [Candidatus Tectomicrobia bacterium]
MPDWEHDSDTEQGAGVLTETRERVDKPPLYKVLLHNDDYTTMDFVVSILRNVFNKSAMAAVQIMLAVHRQGVGIAGVYPYEIAEAKVAKVTELARASEFPLLCTLEKE